MEQVRVYVPSSQQEIQAEIVHQQRENCHLNLQEKEMQRETARWD
jgi:hypothetical protein